MLAFVMLFAALPWTAAAQGDSGTAAISPADIPEGLTAEQLANGAYKLTPKSGEADNRVLASATYILPVNGIDIQQRLYVDDTKLLSINS